MLNKADVVDVLDRALLEDAPGGDVTSNALIPVDATSTARIVAREPGVMAAAEILLQGFPGCWVHSIVPDGHQFDAGATLAEISGPTREILLRERVVLNLAQRLCAIATLTHQYVAAVAATSASILDTRKTTPGLRLLEKHAVVCGGGHNHRFSLSDAALVKDNHLAAMSSRGLDIHLGLREMREGLPASITIEVEVDELSQIEQVLTSGVIDMVLLDNFSLEDLAKGVAMVDGRCLVEASGGVTLSSVQAIAETGVDRISVGALTHGVHSLDIGLDFL